MNELVLAVVAMVMIGTADFWGALGSREGRPVAVAAWGQAVGILGLVIAIPLVGGSPTTADMAYGAASGVAIGMGLIAFYLGFAAAPIGVIAPVSAVTTAATPVAIGLLNGERPSVFVMVGIVLGFVGVALVSAARTAGGGGRWKGALYGLAAGVGFGFGLTLLGSTGDGSGLWPLLATRLAAMAAIAIFAAITSRAYMPVRSSYRYIVLAGLFGVVGMAAFTIAIQTGPLTAVGAITALFPAVTVALAAMVLREHLLPSQVAGVILTIGAVVAITVG